MNPTSPVPLDQQLEALEQKWFAVLQSQIIDKPLPAAASGEIQFFSTDFPRTYVASQDDPATTQSSALPSALLIVCVGLSHNRHVHRRDNEKQIVPHIYTRSGSKTWIIDLSRTRATRRALNTALAAYLMNENEWAENGYASGTSLLPSNWHVGQADFPLVVIKTYLSPFLTTKPWAEYSGAVQRDTLAVWDSKQHIADVIETLRDRINLWLVYGNSVWPHFYANSKRITKWLLTPALTYESQRNGTLFNFWRTKRAEQHLAHPSFP